MQNKKTLSWVVAAAVAVAVGYLAGAAEPKKTNKGDLKSQIMRWDDAKADEADWGEFRKYFTGSTAGTKNILVGVATIKPGKTIHKTHRHANEEYLVIASGNGTWTLEGKDIPAEPGDVLYTEPWAYHGIQNTGKEPLVFFVVRQDGKGRPVPPRPDDKPDEID